MIIYRISDRIPIKVGDVTFLVSPLTLSQRGEISAMAKRKEGEDRVKPLDVAIRSIKYGLKGVEGLTLSDGSVFELEFDDAGNLTDESLEDVMQLDSAELVKTCFNWALYGIGEIEGVTIDFQGVRNVKKK